MKPRGFGVGKCLGFPAPRGSPKPGVESLMYTIHLLLTIMALKNLF